MVIVRADSQAFTYSSETKLANGQLVRISIGKKMTNGLVVKVLDGAPSYPVKPIDSVLEDTPLPLAHVRLAEWLSGYYATPLASVLQTILPAGLHVTRRKSAPKAVPSSKRAAFMLTSEQDMATKTITSADRGTVLLHGRTGSGKTAVYIDQAERAVQAGKSVVVLVPEIALTSQLVAEFASRFDHVLLTHSRQTEAERHAVWRAALNSDKPQVVIGPRSALFLPLANIGLIVIDESHEPSYKQEQSPRYHALRAAHFLASQHQALLILGSATPSVIDYYLAESTGRPIVRMDRLAVKNAREPDVRLIDMTKRANFKRHRFLSDQAVAQIEQDTSSGKQVLLFHNRRGSAATTLCEQCGWQAGCPTCFVPLTLHADTYQLRCHICGFDSKVPTSCPECGHVDIVHKGIGTKLIESEVRRLFPKLTVARFDGDTESAQTVNERFSDLKDGTIQVIIGTQVIAKGLDLPHLHTVVVVQADAGLSLPDYASTERAFQLLSQVVGRVGRRPHETNVIVQSYQPTHPAITLGIKQDYAGFYSLAIQQRKRGSFPPFRFLLKLQCSFKTEAAAIRNCTALAKTLRQELPEAVDVLGPTPAFYERAGGMYRWQLVVKSPRREHLITALRYLPPKNWQHELDPISLL